jgi:thiol-disulfide isomerase/thioredoxin
MKLRLHLWCCLFLVASIVSSASAQQTALPSLDSVQWAGQSVTFEALRGKTVVVLVWATWCPKCNKWSGEMFAQLKDAIRDKPAVVLAINADKTPDAAKKYLTERSFFAPNIVHGYDPTMPSKLGFSSNLFQYAIVKPDGTLGQKGHAGSFVVGQEPQRFVLPMQLAEDKELGQFELLKPEMSPALKQILWPLELGQLPNGLPADARGGLSAEDRKTLDAALDKCLEVKLERVEKLAHGSAAEKFEALDEANRLAAAYKNTDSGKKARALAAELNKDQDFRRELSAKRMYEKTKQQATAAAPARRQQLWKAFIKRFSGTHYAQLAEKEMGANQ